MEFEKVQNHRRRVDAETHGGHGDGRRRWFTLST
jgi:hypothetical protein